MGPWSRIPASTRSSICCSPSRTSTASSTSARQEFVRRYLDQLLAHVGTDPGVIEAQRAHFDAVYARLEGEISALAAEVDRDGRRRLRREPAQGARGRAVPRVLAGRSGRSRSSSSNAIVARRRHGHRRASRQAPRRAARVLPRAAAERRRRRARRPPASELLADRSAATHGLLVATRTRCSIRSSSRTRTIRRAPGADRWRLPADLRGDLGVGAPARARQRPARRRHRHRRSSRWARGCSTATST